MQRYPSLDEVMNALTDLRPLSVTASRVLQLTASEHFSAHELALAISSDQALTAKTLRLANSAYYGFPRQITTVRDAVVLLGFRAVRAATLATCLVDVIPGSNMLDYGAFWHFSLTVGTTAEMLSRAEGTRQDEAFTAGVLHNIGRLALDQHRPALFGQALAYASSRQVSLHEAERAVLGFTAAELGRALAQVWDFPEPLIEAVAPHHLDPAALPDARSLVGFVARARVFARAYGFSDGVEPARQPAEWLEPPIAPSMQVAGGIEGLKQRADAFLEHAVRR